jgi:type II secretory pathway component PulM
MNLMKRLSGYFSQYSNLPVYRHLPQILGAAAIMIVIALMYWLPQAQARMSTREFEAAQALKAIQGDLADRERLQPRASSAKLAGTALRETLLASLSNYGSSVSVDLVDTDHIRIRGSGSFDAIAGWLGDSQQSHRFDISAMEVIRQDGAVSFDVTLSLSQE